MLKILDPGLTSVTYMIEKLLARCVHEVDSESRTLLGTCIGEVGAISEHLLGEIRVSDGTGANPLDGGGSSHAWRLNQPPWQSQVAKYELRLVTKLLVVSLRAAPTSADQHKIAFTIQQLLILLDNSTRRDGGGQKGDGSERAEMSKWLHDKLCESGVFEIIEPFWLSEFSEKVSFITSFQSGLLFQRLIIFCHCCLCDIARPTQLAGEKSLRISILRRHISSGYPTFAASWRRVLEPAHSADGASCFLRAGLQSAHTQA